MHEEYKPDVVDDTKEQFLKYMREKEGQPIDPQAEANAKRELELGEKGDFAVYADEPDRETKMKGIPDGGLYETELTAEELEEEIQDLSVARKSIILFLENPTLENFTVAKETTLFDLEEAQVGLVGGMDDFVSMMAKYDFDGETTLFNLPEELKEKIQKDTRILSHIRNTTK